MTAPRRPPRIQNFSNSFSATNGKSPLIQIKSPNLSQASSPAASPMARHGSGSDKPTFGRPTKEVDPDYFQLKLQPAEQEAEPTAKPVVRGTLRKKGKIFNNERDVLLDAEGTITYYHFDKPGIVKGTIDLKSVQVNQVRFSYAGERAKNAGSGSRPAPHLDDEFRVYMQNKETYIFRASKVADKKNPHI